MQSIPSLLNFWTSCFLTQAFAVHLRNSHDSCLSPLPSADTTGSTSPWLSDTQDTQHGAHEISKNWNSMSLFPLTLQQRAGLQELSSLLFISSAVFCSVWVSQMVTDRQACVSDTLHNLVTGTIPRVGQWECSPLLSFLLPGARVVAQSDGTFLTSSQNWWHTGCSAALILHMHELWFCTCMSRCPTVSSGWHLQWLSTALTQNVSHSYNRRPVKCMSESLRAKPEDPPASENKLWVCSQVNKFIKTV